MFQYISSFFVAPTANQAEDATNAATTTEGVENNNIRLAGMVEDNWMLVDRDCERHSDSSSVESLNHTHDDVVYEGDESFEDRIEVDHDSSFDMIPPVRDGAAPGNRSVGSSRGGTALTPLLTRTSSVSSLPSAVGVCGGIGAMDESWFLTPPPCFVSTGPPVDMATSPLENLLIEHPSMSVYYNHSDDTQSSTSSSSSPAPSPSNIMKKYKPIIKRELATDLCPRDLVLRSSFGMGERVGIDSCDVGRCQTSTLDHIRSYTDRIGERRTSRCNNDGGMFRACRRLICENHRRREIISYDEYGIGIIEVDENVRVDHDNIQYWRNVVQEARRTEAAEEEEHQLKKAQLVTRKRAQKAKKQQTAQWSGRGRMVRNNKAREVNGRNRKERRGERSQGARRSCANNNRKC